MKKYRNHSFLHLGEGVGASSGTFEIIEGSPGVRVGLISSHVVKKPVGVDDIGSIFLNFSKSIPAADRLVVVLLILVVDIPG